MARNVITTITPFDYKDFKQNFSEKNIINQTSGTEYVIDAATVTNIVDINNRSLSIPITPLKGGNTAYCWAAGDGTARGIFVSQTIQGREEYYRHTGTLTIETDQVIVNPNNISIGLTIDYNTYHTNSDIITGDNYAGSYSAYKQICNNSYKTNSNTLTANNKLPYEHTVLRGAAVDFFGWRWGLGMQQATLSDYFPSNSISYKCKKLSNDHYQITISYSIVTWWGKNWAEVGKWSQSNSADLWSATQLNFTISANTVTAREIEFNYARNDELNINNAQGKNYEIKSNEFLQTDENQNANLRQSYALSNQIFDKYDQDRAIVSFTLMNCEKYNINGSQRYLQSEDLIYIQDIDGVVISDEINSNGVLVPNIFEIIKARPIWEGTFYMEVVCRKIDMTS